MKVQVSNVNSSKGFYVTVFAETEDSFEAQTMRRENVPSKVFPDSVREVMIRITNGRSRILKALATGKISLDYLEEIDSIIGEHGGTYDMKAVD